MLRFCSRSPWVVSRPWLNCVTLRTPLATLLTRNTPKSRLLSDIVTKAVRVKNVAPFASIITSGRSKAHHGAPQIARAASKAIRSALKEGNFQIGVHILNAMLQKPLDTQITPLELSPLKLFDFSSFPMPLPSRLVAHSLIHGLLRENLTLEAGKEMQKLIGLGVRFHTKTLLTNVHVLCSELSHVPEGTKSMTEQVSGPAASPEDSEASQVLSSQSTRLTPETHLAMTILATARRSRQRRTDEMYQRLIDACLLQGEIVVATLLFVILVKDWQLKKVLQHSPAVLTEEFSAQSPVVANTTKRLMKLGLPSVGFARQIGINDPSLKLPYPDQILLSKLSTAINHHFLDRDTPDPPRMQAIVSVSILASLLHEQCIPFSHIPHLLRTLQNCPDEPRVVVGRLENGNFVKGTVYNQVHDVLRALCERIPASYPRMSLENPTMLPRLNLRSYNSLIFYALRHRLSPNLANSIIDHMMNKRNPPIYPDIVTYNILLRSASLLRRNDIANKVLDEFRLRPENADHAITVLGPDNIPGLETDISYREVRRNLEKPYLSFPKLRKRIKGEYMDIPSVRRPRLEADNYTLTSYITHLVSIGQPHVVASKIFQLIPEMHIINHPAGRELQNPLWTQEVIRERERECTIRAAKYGPHVFSALLNAIRKSSRTGLAERLWMLALRAERQSWMPSDDPDAPDPWCLPIEAYTSMMQCYVMESRKGLGIIEGPETKVNLQETLNSARQSPYWSPSRRGGKVYVVGWANYYFRMQARQKGYSDTAPALRWATARAVAHLLWISMVDGAATVWDDLMRFEDDSLSAFPPKWIARLQALERPQPDARFFNVLLDIFGRRPGMSRRRNRASPSWWDRKLRVAREAYRRNGRMTMTYDNMLVDIARVMAKKGLELPLGLQRVLIGRVHLPVNQRRPILKYVVRPHDFPSRRKISFRPFQLCIEKTRGLPEGRVSIRPGGRYTEKPYWVKSLRYRKWKQWRRRTKKPKVIEM